MNYEIHLLRQLQPPTPGLREELGIRHRRADGTFDSDLYEFQDGTWWCPHDVMSDGYWTDEIIKTTVGYGIFDGDFNRLAFYRDYEKALLAFDRAKPVIVTEVELEEDLVSDEEPESAETLADIVARMGEPVPTVVLPRRGRPRKL